MSKRSFNVFLALIAGLAFTFGAAINICAQETAQQEFTLEEITVTAQKRAENQQKVPIAMDVISGQQLAESGQDNVSDILKNLSNSMVNMNSDGMRVTVRGLAESEGSFNNMRVSTPTVAINVDGSYNTNNNAGENLFDVERVEVLYGPQSTLYGSNSPGGIVNVVTAAPKLDKYSASGSIEYGSYDLLNTQVTMNAPVISDKVAVRVAASRNKRGTWIENSDNSSKSTNVRFKTLYQPSDKISATITATWGTTGNGGRLGGDVTPFNYQDDVSNPWTASSSGGGPAALGGTQRTKGLSGEFSFDTGIGSLSVVPSWSKMAGGDLNWQTGMGMGGSTTSQLVHMVNSTVQKNAEVRMSSPQDFFFKWIAGAVYYKSDRKNFSDNISSPTDSSHQTSTESNKAVYANLTYPFSSQFRGTAGYRLSWDKAQSLEVPAMKGDGTSGQDYSAPDYKIGVEYDVTESTMAFASFATSYRVNMMGGIGQTSKKGDSVWRSIPPEKLKAYTIGSKSRFFNNKLQFNTSAYFYDYKNKQFTIDDTGSVMQQGTTVKETDYCGKNINGVVVSGAEGLCPDFSNDGQITSDDYSGMLEDPWSKQFGRFHSFGLDTTTNWIIGSDDRVNISLSYMKTKWVTAKLTYYWWWLWVDADGNIANNRDFSGMENTYSPHWSGSVSYQHSFMLGDFGMLVPQVDVQFKSPYTLNNLSQTMLVKSNMPKYANKQEAYYLVNGDITLTPSAPIWNLNWNLNLYVKNATNYAVKTSWMGMGGAGTLGLNDPRTYGAVLSVKF
jgi:iron complex outermembrane recepter protein